MNSLEEITIRSNVEAYMEQKRREIEEKEEEKRLRREKAEERARKAEEARKKKGKKSAVEEEEEDPNKSTPEQREASRVGIRQYARGRAYDPDRFGGVTPYDEEFLDLFLNSPVTPPPPKKKKSHKESDSED